MGFRAIGSNAALAVAKTAVMSVRSDIFEEEGERVAVAFLRLGRSMNSLANYVEELTYVGNR